jgi:dTDP-4-amino-4,6-dideoxygalactose transaminase
MKYKIDWSGRALDYTKEEIDTIVNVAKNADPLTQGSYLSEFENTIKKYVGIEYAFGLTSAASALELIAVLSKLGPGDEVIIPSHTYCASAIPFGRTGATIVWADIDPETFVVSAQDIQRKITKKTKMVVVVHLYGLSCDMEPIVQICKINNLELVEDCAQAFGAKYQDKQVGSFGDYACFSLHAQKNITTLGEGGVLIVKDSKNASMVPGLRHNGHAPYGEREHYWKPAMGNVDLDMEGVWPFNYSMTEVQAALGTKLMERLDSLNVTRRDRAKIFIEEMSDYPELIFQKTFSELQNSYHLLPARYDGESYNKSNDDLIQLLSTKYRIKAIVQYFPLNRYPLFEKMGFGVADCPNTDLFFDNMISFPFHHWMSEDDFRYIVSSTKSALNQLRRISSEEN